MHSALVAMNVWCPHTSYSKCLQYKSELMITLPNFYKDCGTGMLPK